MTGAPIMVQRHGDWFSYTDTARARLLAQVRCQTPECLLSALRENNFLTSDEGTPPGCSGPVGSAAIASRADLQSADIKCSWSPYDFMVVRRAYGATDAKVTSSSLASSLSFLAEAGPTTKSQPPFSWSRSSFSNSTPDFAPVDMFNFKAESVRWAGLGANDQSGTG